MAFSLAFSLLACRLAALHRQNPSALGLAAFGKPLHFYSRQVKTWSTICASQATVKDVETGEVVGELPHMRDLTTYFQDMKTQPRDRSGLVHGDYKIDNLVFHKSEPRVIGILE